MTLSGVARLQSWPSISRAWKVKSQKRLSLIGRYIRARLDGRPTQSFRLSEKQENEIDKIFAKLNSEFEFIDVHYKAKSLTWLRFAFQALRLGLQPSGAYLREYSVWRAERAAKYGFEIIEYTNDGTNRKPQRFP